MNAYITIATFIACFLILKLFISVYKRNKAKSILNNYPMSIEAKLGKRKIKDLTRKEVNLILKRNEYAQEEKERVYVRRVLTKYSFAVTSLLNKRVSDDYYLNKHEIHTIYSNKERIQSIQASEVEKIFKRSILDDEKRKKYYKKFYTPEGLNNIEKKEYYIKHLQPLDEYIKRVICSKIEQLKLDYPNGFSEYKKYYHNNNITISDEKCLENELEITEFEDKYWEINLYKLWENEHSEFTDFSRDQAITKWGVYDYYIDFIIPGYKNKSTIGDYKVWQHFLWGFCKEKDLDYTHFPKVINRNSLVEKLKKKEKYPNEKLYSNVLVIIESIKSEFDNLHVLFGDCNVDQEAHIESHYKILQDKLDTNEIAYSNIRDGISNKISTRYIVIVELFTSNEHLISTCKKIIKELGRNVSPCITYITLLKEYSMDEMLKLINNKNKEIQQQKEEEERKREKERNRIGDIQTLHSKVSSWPIRGGVASFSMHNYYPINHFPDVPTHVWDVRKKVWNFKYDPSKTSEFQHKAALESVLKDTEKVLRHFFGSYTSKLTLVCITASSEYVNMLRYEEFSNRLCVTLNMENGYEYITITEDGTPKHLGGNGKPKLFFNSSFFKDKNILLFDDIITSGRSIRSFKSQLEGYGANVIGALTIGQTKHERSGEDPIKSILL